MMKLKILDRKEGWILAKVSLLDYIEALSEQNFNYDIQRGIVNNPFLDSILDAVVEKKSLPPISLVTQKKESSSDVVEICRFNILDGLQRTFRLWIYYKLAELAIGRHNFDYKAITKEFRNTCDKYTMAVSPRQVRNLFKKDNSINVWNLKDKYSTFDLYMYIWMDLTTEEEIKQMLILNAGQKPMNLSHQFELMYMRLFEEHNFDDDKIKILRSKDGKVTQRIIGNYMMSSVIIGALSLLNMKPMRLSRDMIYKDSDVVSDYSLPYVEDVFTTNFIQNFLRLLFKLDTKISSDKFASDWFAKDTTLAGIMAGIGVHINSISNSPSEILQKMESCIEKIHGADDFSLMEYTKVYDGLSGAKINIGMSVRKAVMIYTEDLLDGKHPSWIMAFDMSMKK